MTVKGALYRTFVPQSVKDALFKMHLREIRRRETAERRAIESTIPEVRLSPSYIHNLRIVVDKAALLSRMPIGSVAVLVGAADLEFARQVLVLVKPKRLHLIDHWVGEDGFRHLSLVKAGFAEAIASGSLEITSGEPLQELRKFVDGYFDWAYLNRSFSYDETYALLEACRVKVRQNGVIAGSNYCTGCWETNERYGVVEAVNRFCLVYRWEMAYLTHERERCLGYAVRQIENGDSRFAEDAGHTV